MATRQSKRRQTRAAWTETPQATEVREDVRMGTGHTPQASVPVTHETTVQEHNPIAPFTTGVSSVPVSFTVPPTPEPFYGSLSNQMVDKALMSAEVYRTLRSTEDMHRSFDPRAKYIKYRRLLVDWIFEATERFRLSNVTAHVAVGYMDRVLQSVQVARNRLQLVALCCLMIAAKYEEAEENVPPASALSEFVNRVYTVEVINQTEVLVLERLGWCCTVVTPLSYLGTFAAQAVVFTDDSMAGKPLIAKVPRYINKYTDFFTDMCQQEYQFARYPPSLLASSIVLAARRALNISPVWNVGLAPVLKYGLEEIQPCFDHVWQVYALKYPDQVTSMPTPCMTMPQTPHTIPCAPTPERQSMLSPQYTPTLMTPQPVACGNGDDMLLSPVQPEATVTSGGSHGNGTTPTDLPTPDTITQM